MNKMLLLFLFIITFPLTAKQPPATLPPGVGIPVLLYHTLTKNTESSSNLYAVSEQVLREQLSLMKAAGYVAIGIEELFNYFYHDKALPKKAFMITFDDGRKDSYEFGDKVLKELGFRAVMFIIPSMQEKEYPLYLSWDTLNTMQKSGRWDIQAHGYHYHNLIPINAQGTMADFASNLMWLKEERRLETFKEYQQRLHEDLVRQKELITKHIKGSKVIAFAFPFGDWGVAAQNINPKLSIAINYEAVNSVFALSFGNVTFTLQDFERTTTPHLISRFMCTQNEDFQQVISHLEKD